MLFIYDTILAFHHRPFTPEGRANTDAIHHLGHYYHTKEFLDNKCTADEEEENVTIPLCRLWRMEIMILIERIRWCYLSSKHCDITRPSDWGSMTDEHRQLVGSPGFVKFLKPILDQPKKKGLDLSTNYM